MKREIVQFDNGGYGIRRELRVFGVVLGRWYYLCHVKDWSPAYIYLDDDRGYPRKTVDEAWKYLNSGRPKKKDFGRPVDAAHLA